MTNNAQFICYFWMATVATIAPIIIMVVMKLAIYKLVIDGLKAFIETLNNRNDRNNRYF